MIAVDTNLLVRLLIQDDVQQAAKVEQLFSQHKIFIADTVILETEWVLRFAYKIKVEEIHLGLSQILGLENVFVRDQLAVQQALEWFQAGMDFADAWHLALSQPCKTFATFGQKLVKRTSQSSFTKTVVL